MTAGLMRPDSAEYYSISETYPTIFFPLKTDD